MSYYQLTARVERMTEQGERKKVNEKHLVKALMCFDAIETATGELHSTTNGEFEITEVKKTSIAEAMGDLGCGKYFLAKVNFITVDEKSGREKKTASQWFIGAVDYDTAKAVLTAEIKKSMADIEIASLAESPIVGFIKPKQS